MEQNQSDQAKGFKKGPYNDAELAFIRRHALVMSDREIGEKLNRNSKGVNRMVHKLGIKRKSGEAAAHEQSQADIVDQKLKHPDGDFRTQEERKAFFQAEFMNSKYWEMIKDTLLSLEQNFFLEEWGAYLDEVETLTAAEKRTLFELIMCQIDLLRDRKRLNALQTSGHSDPVLEKELRRSISDTTSNHMKLSSDLKMTRKQRLEGRTEGGLSLTKLVQQMQEKSSRRDIGKIGGALRIAIDKQKSQFVEEEILLQGSKEDKEGEGDEEKE